ncbi:MAG: type I polyketide synthase [Nostoc sp. ChiSLP02]|nr:type I polyketide synthase [Nostoc sp. DedSLP05]MDZ8101178.1 type I polyketide synthase [Nostoc sp. DedSLP01]MDZ8188308.1 type I polyketide synthase [Nostoc sp. ChiSLP02]
MAEYSPKVDQLNSSQRLLLALKEARAKLEAVERSKSEPIAIVGASCRFPGKANNPEAFWQLLRNGVDAITEVPPQRWDIDAYYDPEPDTPGKIYTRFGGFLEDVDQFDPQFFGMSPRTAAMSDPQQRLLLQVSWEALENAGQVPERLSGSQTGVFVGITTNDYARLLLQDGGLSQIDANYITGNPLNTVAGRLSYTLGLQGPSLVVDTACSSSLVAVHLACQSLRNQECDRALAGGVNVILSPEGAVALCRTRMMSQDGRCKTFDANADGFVRSEGCGVIVLKRLSDALADGDNILALIRGSAVNHNGGSSSSFLAPSGVSQQAVIRKALENSGVKPADIDYVEVQGTGTALGGDPLEVAALAAVYSQDRPRERPLVIGSVKTNIGHPESAAGIAALLKVVLSLQNKEIPPHLNFKQPNPHINWDKLPVKVPTELMPWSSDSRRLAAVNSYGASGTNAHVVLEEAPVLETITESAERPLHLLTLSAKTDVALKQLAKKYESHLAAHPELPIQNICFTANTGRLHFEHRLSAIATSSVQLHQQLAAFAAGQQATAVFQGQIEGNSQPKIAFVFAGEESQYVNMGRQLYETQPEFRKWLERCENILGSELKQPLIEILYPQTRTNSPLNETSYSQPALFAVEYALFQLWKSWGIEPSVVMGHGVGEYVAACVAGIFTLEEGLQLVAQRGRLLETLSSESILEKFQQAAEAVTYYKPQIAFVSSLTGELATNEVSTPEYWCDRLQQPGKFAASIQTLARQEYKLFVEIGCQPLGNNLPDIEGVWLPSLNPEKEDWQQLLESLATLYVGGVRVDWLGFDRGYLHQRLPLPTYSWQQQRCWFEPTKNGRGKLENSSIANLFSQSDRQQLVNQLENTGELTKDELRLLPRIVEFLIEQFQQEIEVSQPHEKIEQTSIPQVDVSTLTAADIQVWLVNKVVNELGVKSEDINLQAPFDSYGLDSVLAIGIASAGEQYFGVKLSPLVLVHYPTIESLSHYLAQEIAASESEMFEI